jgi:hypothetical protein
MVLVGAMLVYDAVQVNPHNINDISKIIDTAQDNGKRLIYYRQKDHTLIFETLVEIHLLDEQYP